MRKHVVDTNLYIEASRSDEAADALRAFHARYLPYIYLHSVVAQELLAGAVTPALQRDTEAGYLEPFEAVGRVITPTHRTWKRAGVILSRLIREKRVSPDGIRRSFVNDCLLAASAREHGFVLVSRNTADFDLIRAVEPMTVVPPWPGRSLR